MRYQLVCPFFKRLYSLWLLLPPLGLLLPGHPLPLLSLPQLSLLLPHLPLQSSLLLLLFPHLQSNHGEGGGGGGSDSGGMVTMIMMNTSSAILLTSGSSSKQGGTLRGISKNSVALFLAFTKSYLDSSGLNVKNSIPFSDCCLFCACLFCTENCVFVLLNCSLARL